VLTLPVESLGTGSNARPNAPRLRTKSRPIRTGAPISP